MFHLLMPVMIFLVYVGFTPTFGWTADKSKLTGTMIMPDKYKGFERGESLIMVTELKKLMDVKDADLVILAVAKPTDYGWGHIPGAHRVWRTEYETGVNKPYPFGGMILNRAGFEKFARNTGSIITLRLLSTTIR